ncbi:hypothetical protein H5410_056319 [Solanum commersonii]|uniref:Uncharacterized protein n=1 Tax=Solanum commersonii TaxID=4109 RepID=A0A9J5WJY4_SOLCO|nr:hypothetical protein H5410_056319 [Solanum commersonii]
MQRVLIKEKGFLGCDRNTESTRFKSKFLELKLFESSSSSKPSPNFELKTNYSTSLVEIADQLSDSSFGRFHRRHALSFSIIVFGSLGDIHTGAKGEDKIVLVIRRMSLAILRSLFLHSFSCLCSFLLNCVHAFPQTPNT